MARYEGSLLYAFEQGRRQWFAICEFVISGVNYMLEASDHSGIE